MFAPGILAGRTPLHWAALEGGDESIIETLLDKGADATAVDAAGDSPLHLAARAGLPMATYQVCCAAPATTLAMNAKAQTPVDLAAAGERSEVLNAMLLACAGAGGGEPAVAAAVLTAMRIVLERGAVCDTWAPNGSSALMLAASSAATDAAPVELLLQNGASLELQDALGRTATMFAAGNGATAGLRLLLDAGASISVRDRRGKNVLDYAMPGSEARALLEERLAQMESRASRLQVRAGGREVGLQGWSLGWAASRRPFLQLTNFGPALPSSLLFSDRRSCWQSSLMRRAARPARPVPPASPPRRRRARQPKRQSGSSSRSRLQQ